MSSDQKSYALHWFRRDLRVASNPALMASVERYGGRVLGVFFFDSEFLSRADFSYNRFGFFLETLKSLKMELAELGGDLLVLDAKPTLGFAKLFQILESLRRPLPSLCSFNRDYEPYARNRDTEVERFLFKNYGIESLTAADHLLLEPNEVRRPDGGTYQVFTPFSKKWFSVASEASARSRLKEEVKALRLLKKRDRGEVLDRVFHLKWSDLLDLEKRNKTQSSHPQLEDQLEKFLKSTLKQVSVPLPFAGSLAAFRALTKFKEELPHYSEGRNYPAQDFTSHLSIYLKNGSLTSAQIFATLEGSVSSQAFFRQIVWREFYYHILFHHPAVENQAFREKYRNIQWENREDWFEAWKQGQTGFPLVDAGMRELLATGLMHNRVRMVVASFLTKDLLIDWRWGERWFMQNLLDGDLAANNGGWQWAASTGCDPQPYFRIFNPELQSRRFDPKGEYIRKYIPELHQCSDSEIHAPSSKFRSLNSYPMPIVDHAKQKVRAIRLFK